MADIFNFYVYDDRSIQFAIAEPIMLEDKDVTQFRFRIPKSLNGFGMSDWEWWFIFVNPKGTKYTTLLELSDDEDEPEEYSVATYTVGYGFSGIVGTVRFSIEALNVSGEEIVNEWHTKTYSTAVIDTLQGLRAVIPEPDGQVSTGITEEVKQALLQIARKVAYIDEHGQTYYNALYDALYAITAVTVSPRSISLSAIGQTSQLTAQTIPAGGTITWSTNNASVATVSENGLVTATGLGTATITATSGGKSGTCSVLVAEATLTEISAVYTPSGTVYESDSLDSLKSGLVVTAHWSNDTTSDVASADYTLSGTLTTGTSTVTVSYGGMTTTFDVTVVGLTGITATYTQSGTVYDTASLDDLKSDLVVTANYSDSTSETVTDYTLSGTLAEGTSTVTVSYGGKTATFEVTVSSALIYNWDFTQSLTDTKSGRDAVLRGTNTAPTQTSAGIVFDAATQNLYLGEIAMKGKILEVDVASFQFAGNTSNHIRFIMNVKTGGTLSGQGALIFRSGGGWSAYGTKTAGGTSGAWASSYLVSGATDAVRNMFNGKTVKLVFDADSNAIDYYADGEHIGTYSEFATTDFNALVIGGGLSNWSTNNGDQCYNMTISGVRVYANEV